MASANGSAECSSTAVPQWKRDLIQRRRQQNKVLTSNGASAKLCSAVSGQLSAAGNVNDTLTASGGEPVVERLTCSSVEEQHSVVGASCVLTSRTSPRVADNIGSCTEHSTTCNRAQQLGGSTTKLSCQASCGATCTREGIASPSAGGPTGGERLNQSASSGASHEESSLSLSPPSVVCNMRLDTDASSFCPSSEDATSFNNNSSTRNNHAILITPVIERVEFDNNYENGDENNMRNYTNNGSLKRAINNREQDCDNGDSGGGIATRIIRKMDGSVCLYPSEGRKNRKDTSLQSSNGKVVGDECESDSSEELQYGPGIVNRLKSKYLNLTLREMNKSRVTVQRFRRAASLEDLLDCDDEQSDKTTRKYAKRTTPAGVAVKTDRYRNATRGNDSMKRARSVETLMRYNAPLINEEANRVSALRQETANDHIVLIDRTSVKIESRLLDPDRPKAINKPKRIKPLLAETERPPPDLVKTTMRLFEGSVKKFKPKGEVAVKVATFKTINDTYKAQTMKKVVPKPPIQPKPFVNGNNKLSTSPKKFLLTGKPTAEIIEQAENEEYKREGVVTEPIVQSVSSVVSKFQQIEKSYSPSGSPEPSFKLKFSPSPSPEPSLATKLSRSNENLVKSPPVTPVSSPRISSPPVPVNASPSPVSPKREAPRQHSTPPSPPCATSPIRESSWQISPPEVSKATSPRPEEDTREKSSSLEEPPGHLEILEDRPRRESNTSDPPEPAPSSISSETPSETVDGSRTISKLALDNISKAGITMQYNFGDKSSIGKTYLPGVNVTGPLAVLPHNGQKSETSCSPTSSSNGEASAISRVVKMASPTPPLDAVSSCSSPISIDSMNEDVPARLSELSEPESSPEPKSLEKTSTAQSEYAKPIGAISSLGLVKSSPSPSHSTANDISSKIMKHHKTDVSPPQKQIGIIRPLVSTKTQQSQQNLSNRELEKNLINRVKSIEQPTKVVVSLKTADEITPPKKITGSPAATGTGNPPATGGGGLWDSKHWNTPNNTMVFNFSNRKDVPDYIENDGLIIRRKREKQKVGDGGVIVLDATLDASTTDDSDWEISGGPPSPCDVSFSNDNILINGRSNLSKQPRNHKHRIQFDDGATKTFEYPSEASMLADEGTSVDSDSSSTSQQSCTGTNKSNSNTSASTMSSALLEESTSDSLSSKQRLVFLDYDPTQESLV
ncbi:serine/arginine repetitive matrix protein 1 isoform X2 [Venturia canescens]|uniref:serine/arginine repetitive matrix protein 1 isoform X2 n=1 Tax=Venturia canescens TaxID=32260 RepID=UPI001C9C1AC4|nr:serine/arginine repetitive matrix protein 1 isoform X2 [Venturia canescens]